MHSKEHHVLIHSAGLRPCDWMRFGDVGPFRTQWNRLGMTAEHLEMLQFCIMTGPCMGRKLRGSAGLRRGLFQSEDSSPTQASWSSWDFTLTDEHATKLSSAKQTWKSYWIDYVFSSEYSLVLFVAIWERGCEIQPSSAGHAALVRVTERLKGILERGTDR